MKHKLLLASLLAGSVVLPGMPLTPVTAHAHGPEGPCVGPVLQTAGESEMTVSPDAFTANGTIQVESKTTIEATAEANQTMAELKKKLEALKIPGLVLKTTQYNTHPIYPPYDPKHQSDLKKRQPIGYRHSQTLEVKVEGILASDVLVSYANRVLGVMSGVEDVQPGGLNWYLSSGTPYEAELLAAAVTKAKQRAEIMATAAGAQLQGVCEINYHPQRVYAQPMMMKAARGAAMDMAEAAPQVEAGDQTLNVQVNVRYQLAPKL